VAIGHFMHTRDGELDGRHVITIEGLASGGLTPVMDAMLDEGASQCGFCSPGFILALTGYLVSGSRIDPVEAMVAVEGNLCRCTRLRVDPQGRVQARP